MRRLLPLLLVAAVAATAAVAWATPRPAQAQQAVPARAAQQLAGCAIGQDHSLNGDAKANITFVNQTAGTVKIYWLDYTGKRVYYADLAAGQSYTQASYVTHPWVALDAAGACVGYVVVAKDGQVYVIGHTDKAKPKPACADGKDNDGDSLSDAQDPGCASKSDTDESNHFISVICGKAKLDLYRGSTVPGTPDVKKGTRACLVLASNPTVYRLLARAKKQDTNLTSVFGKDIASGVAPDGGEEYLHQQLEKAKEELLKRVFPPLAHGIETYGQIGTVSDIAKFNAYAVFDAIWTTSILSRDACLSFWLTTKKGKLEVGTTLIQNPSHLATKDYKLGIISAYTYKKGGFGGKWTQRLTSLQCGPQGQTVVSGSTRDNSVLFSSIHISSYDG